jgi:hypothetical protein
MVAVHCCSAVLHCDLLLGCDSARQIPISLHRRCEVSAVTSFWRSTYLVHSSAAAPLLVLQC